MKRKMPNGTLVWKQLDDRVVPNLDLNVVDRAVYSHLLRHTRLEGQRRLHFTLGWLAKGVRVCTGAARPAFRRLLAHGVLRLVQQTGAGQIVEVLLPEEIPGALSDSGNGPRRALSVRIQELDFFRTPALRHAIHAREHGACFYCLRRINAAVRCLDHVVAQARAGSNSYRNVVSCCLECNSRKGQTPAAEFLRWLYREGRLSSRDLTARLRALEALAAGKLRPPLPDSGNSSPRKDRPRLHPAAREIDGARRQR